MGKKIILLLLAALSLSPRGQQDSESLQAPSSTSYSGTLFQYEGQEYDISARMESVNAITGCTPVGKYIVVEGHCGPKNSVYSIFDTETKDFEKDVFGCNLIWYDDDITTAVYSFWSGVYAYDGTLLKDFDISETAFIYDLEFAKDYSEVVVTIEEDGDSFREEILPLSGGDIRDEKS